MSRERTSMRKTREILLCRLTHKMSLEQTRLALKVSKGTVHSICTRFSATGLAWPLPDDLSDTQLEKALYPPAPQPNAIDSSPFPDPAVIERELARPGVTRELLYLEYCKQFPNGKSRASFFRYTQKSKTPELSMHLEHKGGDILYCDYSGNGISWIDRVTGEVHSTQLFVATLAASSYTYAEVTASQQEEHFAMSHARAFAYFGGVTASIVPDNLKSAVIKAHRYDPTINPLFAKLAAHYGTVVLPARVRHPRDKGAVESAVLVAQHWIVAALRDREFFSVAEINTAVAEQLELVNDRPMKGHGGISRRERFVVCDKPHLKPLPAEPFRITKIKHDVYVGNDYHIQFEKHHYSVPFTLAKKRVDVHQTDSLVEIYHDGVHVCRHRRGNPDFRYSTSNDHMPPAHAFGKGITPEWLTAKAIGIGPFTGKFAKNLLQKHQHPQQGFRAVFALLDYARAYSAGRLEKASEMALTFNATGIAPVKSILLKGLDLQNTLEFPVSKPITHENIRGETYFNHSEERVES